MLPGACGSVHLIYRDIDIDGLLVETLAEKELQLAQQQADEAVAAEAGAS